MRVPLTLLHSNINVSCDHIRSNDISNMYDDGLTTLSKLKRFNSNHSELINRYTLTWYGYERFVFRLVKRLGELCNRNTHEEFDSYFSDLGKNVAPPWSSQSLPHMRHKIQLCHADDINRLEDRVARLYNEGRLQNLQSIINNSNRPTYFSALYCIQYGPSLSYNLGNYSLPKLTDVVNNNDLYSGGFQYFSSRNRYRSLVDTINIYKPKHYDCKTPVRVASNRKIRLLRENRIGPPPRPSLNSSRIDWGTVASDYSFNAQGTRSGRLSDSTQGRTYEVQITESGTS